MQYKVIALSVGGKSNRIFQSGDIVTADCFVDGHVDQLVADGFLEPLGSTKEESNDDGEQEADNGAGEGAGEANPPSGENPGSNPSESTDNSSEQDADKGAGEGAGETGSEPNGQATTPMLEAAKKAAGRSKKS